MELGFTWSDVGPALSRLAVNLFTAAVILVAGYLAGRLAERLTRQAVERATGISFDHTPTLARVARAVVMILAAVAALGRLGVQTASITALVGAAGLAVGLALQGTLSNVAAGIMLMTLRPFKLGDGIEVSGTSGTVTDIGLFMTRVVTWDGVVVYLPNGGVWGARIVNFSQAVRRRFDLVVGISYADDVSRALAILREVVTSDPRVLTHPEPLFRTSGFTDISVGLLAQYWTTASDFLATQSDLTKRVKERFDAEGITIPTRQVPVAGR
ncbi:MAG TPA: mechanosensitive ion channel domain-containing protein [Trueperaceae bacterium]